MNYQQITDIAGPDVARIINEDSDSFVYEDIDAEAVDDLARGAQVLGVETIDYPLPDGLIIYLKRPPGDVVALLVETDEDDAGLYELLRTKAATIQEAPI